MSSTPRNTTSPESHWERVYGRKVSQELSWYTPHLQHSLSFVDELNLSRDSSIIDVGAGDSTFADDLLDRGFSRITLLDVSSAALERTKARLRDRSNSLSWIVGDVTKTKVTGTYDLWHDRAVFHFLVDPQDRARYVEGLNRALKPTGALIIATFSLDGPEKCSGLPTMRYDGPLLQEELGTSYRLVKTIRDPHVTPAGRTQDFLYCLFRRMPQP